ncbi:MAG: hypothetical protein ACOYXA_14450 [Bacteroidota bacterium]
MKTNHLLLVWAFSLLTFGVQSQDIIVMRDGAEINAKVEEVDESIIKYRKFDNLTVPLFTVPK